LKIIENIFKFVVLSMTVYILNSQLSNECTDFAIVRVFINFCVYHHLLGYLLNMFQFSTLRVISNNKSEYIVGTLVGGGEKG
jgi:hypothetical protein